MLLGNFYVQLHTLFEHLRDFVRKAQNIWCLSASLSCKPLFVQVVAVPDLFLTAVKLTHDKTGAQYLHAARDDSNNLFRLVHTSVLMSYSVSDQADEFLFISLVSSSERLPWTAQGSRTSWSTRCCAGPRSIPAETPSSRCSTGHSPHSWTLSQVQRHQRSHCCWLNVNFIIIKIVQWWTKASFRVLQFNFIWKYKKLFSDVHLLQRLLLFFWHVFRQPVTTPCIRSQRKMGRTSRIFSQSIWMQFSSHIYESRISGEILEFYQGFFFFLFYILH